MRINFVQVQNFKSFAGGDIDFSELPDGLYFVSGENKVEPELGANGAGKSALFEAICWCLYGKTSTNLKASNIVKWGEKGGAVEVRFDEFTVTRGQSPNYLHIDHEPVAQEELEKKLGYVGFESFLYSTFISQFSSKFFDLTPADKMFVFSDIMAETLHPWELRSDKAKAKSIELKSELEKVEKQIATYNGNLATLKESDYSELIKDFEEKLHESLNIIKEEIADLSAKYRIQRANLKNNLAERIQLQQQIKNFTKTDIDNTQIDIVKKNYQKDLDLIVDKIRDCKQKLDSHTQNIFRLKAEKQRYTSQIRDIDGISQEATCPTCLQKVSKTVLKDEKAKLMKICHDIDVEWSDDKSSSDLCNTELNRLKKDHAQTVTDMNNTVDELRETIRQQEKTNSELLTKLKVAETTRDSLTTSIQEIETRIKREQQRLVDVEDQENPYIKLEEKRLADMKTIQMAIDDRKAIYDNQKKDYDAYTYWIKGFKEIRLLLMYDALKEFEVSINNNISKFGMEGWSVKLDIDQENKSGTVRKGFSVLVESPNHSGYVPFEVWSGGEGQRLRLAGTIGLMDLIQSKRQLDFGMEVFDEPTAWMSSKGIDDLLQILYYRAKENSKRIFIIDHKNLGNFGGFHQTIQVVKDNDGSHVEIN